MPIPAPAGAAANGIRPSSWTSRPRPSLPSASRCATSTRGRWPGSASIRARGHRASGSPIASAGSPRRRFADERGGTLAAAEDGMLSALALGFFLLEGGDWMVDDGVKLELMVAKLEDGKLC